MDQINSRSFSSIWFALICSINKVTLYYWWKWSWNETRQLVWKLVMSFIAVTIVFAFVIGHSLNKKGYFWLVHISGLFVSITVARLTSSSPGIMYMCMHYRKSTIYILWLHVYFICLLCIFKNVLCILVKKLSWIMEKHGKHWVIT